MRTLLLIVLTMLSLGYKDADKTFYGQSTYVQSVVGQPGLYIALFDRWKKTNLPDSRYLWLPLRFEQAAPKIAWQEAWAF